MKSQPMDIFLIILISIYTICIFILLVFDDKLDEDQPSGNPFEYSELFVLFIFMCEITANIYAFRMYFLNDIWNILDIIFTMATVLFVILDIITTNVTLASVLKIRALFRLLRVFLLLRRVFYLV